MNDLTIKASFDPNIVDTDILKLFSEGKYEPHVICDQYLI